MSKRLREWRLSRARARAEKPADPDPDEKFAKQAHDLDALRKTVEDAAAVSAGFWLSYLFVLFYIGIAAGTVTHKDLLLENSVELPFLNVELPLVAFFLLAPILFIVSHAYTLVHFVMLAAKVGVLHTDLKKQFVELKAREDLLRRQLPSNIFVQFLAGPEDIRRGGLGWLLKTIAWISLVIGPVLLLLLIQVQFLPYHLEWVTWLQRFAILIDVMLLWALWPAVLNGRSEIKWPRLWRHPVLTLASLVPIGIAFTAATFPGEWLDENLGNKQWIPPNRVTARFGLRQEDDERRPILTSVHDLLFNGEVDHTSRRRKSLFSNTLVLPSFDAVEGAKVDDPKKLERIKQTLILRGRHLEGAVFNDADLRKVDLQGAQLQGVSLEHAQLQGASLSGTELRGASLDYAKLQGASLLNAQLQGASLYRSQLQDALLALAYLQGASLKRAYLQGALLDDVQLQGASLEEAKLAAAELYNAFVWRARFSLESIEAFSPQEIVWGAKHKKDFISDPEPWTESSYLVLKKLMETLATPHGFLREEVGQGKLALNWRAEAGSDAALKRIEILDPNKPFEFEDAVPNWKKKIEAKVLPADERDKALARELKVLICSGDADSVYVVRGLVFNDRISDTGAEAPGLVKAILKPDCQVSAALTESDKRALRKLSAAKMQELVCGDNNNALIILRGFLNDGYIKESGDQALGLVESIRSQDCSVSAALTEADKAALKKLAEEAKPGESKQ